MASSLVKCKYCGISFNKDKEQYVKVSNRYAHIDCHNEHTKNTDALKQLTDFIQALFGKQYVNWNVVGTQIKKYKNEGMTYMGMYYTLVYFYKVKKNDVNKGAGVGIIPYQYKKAQQYYETVDNIYTQKAKIDAMDVLPTKQTENIITITQKPNKKKLIDIEY